MRMVRLALVLLLLCCSALCLSADAAISVSFEERTLVVRGASPSGVVAVAGVGHRWISNEPYLVKYVSSAAADAAGSARIDVGDTIPFRSIWLVLDVDSGNYAVATPPNYVPSRLNATDLLRDGPGAIQVSRSSLEVVVARAHRGLWRGTAIDGRTSDRDGRANGHVRLDLKDLAGVLNSGPPPDVALPGDVILVVDPDIMSYQVHQVTSGEGASDAH